MDQTDDDPHQPISMLASMKDATYHKKKTF